MPCNYKTWSTLYLLNPKFEFFSLPYWGNRYIFLPSGGLWLNCNWDVGLGDVRPGDVRLGNVGFGDLRMGDPRLGDVGLGDLRIWDMRLRDVRLGDVRLGDVRLGNVRPGDVRLGDVRLGDVGLKLVVANGFQRPWLGRTCLLAYLTVITLGTEQFQRKGSWNC